MLGVASGRSTSVKRLRRAGAGFGLGVGPFLTEHTSPASACAGKTNCTSTIALRSETDMVLVPFIMKPMSELLTHPCMSYNLFTDTATCRGTIMVADTSLTRDTSVFGFLRARCALRRHEE